MRRLLLSPLLLLCSLTACPGGTPKPPPVTVPVRCEVKLEDSGFFPATGTGAQARQADASLLPGGPQAAGRAGDFVLENDRLRAVVQQAGRQPGPFPFGGALVDADLKRGGGASGRDAWGGLGLLAAFGRTVAPERVEVLRTGEGGGIAAVAVTGTDVLADTLFVADALPGVAGASAPLVVDPETPLSLLTTTYYVVSPGEPRVRVLTAFCNTGTADVTVPVGDVLDPGAAGDFFNPEGCNGTLGSTGCAADTSSLVAFQGEGVAYGYRTWQLGDARRPELENAIAEVDGLTVTLAGGKGVPGLLQWSDRQATTRPGAVVVPRGGQALFLRDLYVAKDLAELHGLMLAQESRARVRLNVTVEREPGVPAPGARVAVVAPQTDRLVTVLVADAQGKASGDLEPGAYRAVVGMPGVVGETLRDLAVAGGGVDNSVTVSLPTRRRFTVNVRDEGGAPLPAKVTVLCPGGACPQASGMLTEVEPLPSDVLTVGLVPPSGTLTLEVPPAQYAVTVTRGPEYSAWPATFPQGETVDLSSADAERTVTLGRVVDSTDWAAVDLDVRTAASVGVDVPASQRVLSALAEGLDAVASAERDAVVDLAPAVQAAGAQGLLGAVVGQVLPTSFGPVTVWPARVDAEKVAGGPFDWAGGTDAGLRLDQLFPALRQAFPGAVVGLSAPRSGGGVLSRLQVDTATLASHADPADLRVASADGAAATDTRLFSGDFQAMEVMSGPAGSFAALNDWMTFLSRGQRVAPTASAGARGASVPLGYGRTYVQVPGKEAAATFEAAALSEAVRGGRVVASNGPFVRVSAKRADGSGTAVGPGDTLSVPAGQGVELAVDVQGPAWMGFTFVELYAHAPGREAIGGAPNSEWPDSRILERFPVPSEALQPEAVPGSTSGLQRVHVTHSFTVTPQRDEWYVVMVRSGSAARPFFPMVWGDVTCDGARCAGAAVRPFAVTSPVFVDADGSGAYDDFPLK